jgi:hypothetical protein
LRSLDTNTSTYSSQIVCTEPEKFTAPKEENLKTLPQQNGASKLQQCHAPALHAEGSQQRNASGNMFEKRRRIG